MKRLISLHLVLILLAGSLTGLAPLSANAIEKKSAKCENGECVDKMIDRLVDLGQVYQKECAPSEGLKDVALTQYYEENGLTEHCWKVITEVNFLEQELQKHQARLEEKMGCQNGDCRAEENEGINNQLAALNKVEKQLACTGPKKADIKKKCPEDLNCALAAGLINAPLAIPSLGMSGYVIEKLTPEKLKILNCHMGDDSCSAQLATGFLKAVANFFEGAWDLLKLAGGKIAEFWKSVRGAEDHSSTSQLALAKASEDPGVFDMLIKDFPGTLKKIWQALVASLKEWMKNDIFCQKWSGAPHFSKCLAPTESFDCISCKAMVNGVCAISGTVLSEIVPAFLTDGIISAAKHGAEGASKIAKIFKISDKGMQAIKESRIGKMAIETASKASQAAKASKTLQIKKLLLEVL